MDMAKEYIFSVLIISLVSGIINIFAPEGSVKKYVKYIVSLAVVLTLLIPFKNFILEFPKLMKYNANLTESDTSEAEDNVDNVDNSKVIAAYASVEIISEIENAVKNQYDIDVKVEMELNTNDCLNITINKIYIEYCGTDKADDIKAYVEDLMQTEVVMVELGEP